MKKFELTESKKNWKGVSLYQIKACINFTTNTGIEISEGELGGWIEKEENLSQEGKSWIWKDAKVCGSAEISKNAEVYGNAEIFGAAKIDGNAKISGDTKISGNAIVCGNAIIYGDAEISSPDQILNVTPVGKYRLSLTFFKTKNDLIKISYNWKIYTLEEFESIMSDWTNEEQKVAKAAIELAKLQIKI